MIPTTLIHLIATSAVSFPYAVAATPNDRNKMPLQARDSPKLIENSGENWRVITTTKPLSPDPLLLPNPDLRLTQPPPPSDGALLYHHSPPAEQCVGIDQQTKSVYLVNGFGESNLVQAFLDAGECDHGQGGAMLTWDVNQQNCFRVERPGEGSGRVGDVLFPIA